MNLNLKDLEKQFYSDGYRLAMAAVQNNKDPEALHAAVKNMYRFIDELTESFSDYAVTQGKGPVCSKGCYWCCHQPVYALSYELETLAAFIKERFNSEERSAIYERARKKREKLEGLSPEELASSKYPCPLLLNGACIAYEARPVACRIYLSSDLNSCLHFFDNPDDKSSFPALLNFPMRMGRLMNEGFKAGLKANGKTTEEFRIEEKMKGEPL